jgi:tRNA dimethylallyltransferase
MTQYRAILIAGPTSSGKSAAALALAERLNGVIVNADSMQVYRELRVLTARPGPEDEARVPHALYGFVPAAEAYSAGKWIGDVSREIATAEAARCLPIITGGTGLYFRALLEGLSPIPDIPEAVRDRWREQARLMPAGELHAVLRQRDPVMADQLRPSDLQRIVRALEVLDATGRSLSDWQAEPEDPLLQADSVLRLYVAPPRDVLYARIDARFDKMMEEGALDEVRALAAQDLAADLPVMRALGVKQLFALLAGEISRAEAADRVKTETRRYAKRQLTWSRSNMLSWERIETKDIESFRSSIFSFIDV